MVVAVLLWELSSEVLPAMEKVPQLVLPWVRLLVQVPEC